MALKIGISGIEKVDMLHSEIKAMYTSYNFTSEISHSLSNAFSSGKNIRIGRNGRCSTSKDRIRPFIRNPEMIS